jgi:hypothetical protein
MSMVTVHGPNTMYTTESGGISIPSTGGGIATATKSPTNGLVYTFSVANPGARPAADFDWTFTGPGSPAAQADRFGGTVTYTGAGAGSIILTVAAGAGPPAGGTYTITTAPTAGTPRSVEGRSAPADTGDTLEYDPGDFTVAEVMEYVNEHPDDARAIYDVEVAGKNRSSLVSQLEALIPYDPGDWTVPEVVTYAQENPSDVPDILAAEEAGKNRATLISQLQALI